MSRENFDLAALVAGVTASLVGALGSIVLKLVLDKVGDVSHRLVTIEKILIAKGLHNHEA